MKKLLLSLSVVLFTTIISFAQSLGPSVCYSYVCPDPTFSGNYERAMYIDDFLRFDPTSGALRTDLSILGESADETALFNYCNNNNITTIYLYNFKNIYDRFIDNYPFTTTTYATLLSDFITDAHANGLTVGVAVGGNDATKKAYWWNGNKTQWHCEAIVAYPQAALRAVQNQIDLVPKGEYSPYLETVKELIQVYIYSKYFRPDTRRIDFANPQVICTPSIQINRIITEYEFWRHKIGGGASGPPDLVMNTLDY